MAVVVKSGLHRDLRHVVIRFDQEPTCGVDSYANKVFTRRGAEQMDELTFELTARESGLRRQIADQQRLRVAAMDGLHRAADPLSCVAIGTGKYLEELDNIRNRRPDFATWYRGRAR